jgi:gamma-glutamyltranspeptidase/glutathione hydrolase
MAFATPLRQDSDHPSQEQMTRYVSLSSVTRVAVLCSMLTPFAELPAQRGTSPADEGKRAEGRNGAVTSANALASEAGLTMLRAGGNAVDAAVATAFAIGVVEPQMSGLGGSGSATIYMKREGKPAYLDFYAAQPVEAWRDHPSLAVPAAAPAQAAPANPTAQTEEAPTSAPGDLRVVGVPGAVAGLLALHERYGVLTRAQVMAPAIRLADEGFPVGQILADFIVSGADRMKPFPKATALYVPAGRPLAPGEIVKNPELATSLRRIAAAGRKGFYEGPTAEALVAALNAGGHPLRLSDLARYEPQWKRPLCTAYRGLTVLSAPPPQTGHQILHALELLEPYNLKTLGLPTQSARAFDLLASALRAGQSQSRFNADPNWAAVPANGLTSSVFAASRSGVVGTGRAATAITPADAAVFDTATPPVLKIRLPKPHAAQPSGGRGKCGAGEPTSRNSGKRGASRARGPTGPRTRVEHFQVRARQLTSQAVPWKGTNAANP